MEAAIEFLQMGSLEGKVVAIQGAGNVGNYSSSSSLYNACFDLRLGFQQCVAAHIFEDC